MREPLQWLTAAYVIIAVVLGRCAVLEAFEASDRAPRTQSTTQENDDGETTQEDPSRAR